MEAHLSRRQSICHVATTFNQRSGSAQRATAIIEACVAAGHLVVLIVGRDHDIEPDSLSGVSVEVVEELRKPIAPLHDLGALLGIARRLRRLRPDLVHTHLAKAGILGRLAAVRAGVPRIVHTVHGPTFPAHLSWARRQLYRILESWTARSTDAMVYVGEELRAIYLASRVGSAEISRVIRTGRQRNFELPDRESRIQLRRLLTGGATCELLLVHVGRLVPSKRPEHAVLALGRLVEQGLDAHLVLVGEALVDSERAYSRTLRRRVISSPMAARVHFSGFREDVLEIMSCADAVLLTSSHEGLPNVAVEAALAGTPVIGYPVTGLGEVVEHGVTGWITIAHSPAELVDGLLAIHRESAPTRARLARRRDTVADRYSAETMVEKTLSLYGRLLA